jgi:hypothetical protein
MVPCKERINEQTTTWRVLNMNLGTNHSLASICLKGGFILVRG